MSSLTGPLFLNVAPASRRWSCHTPCITGYTSAQTRTSNTPSSPGSVGASTGEPWTTNTFAFNRRSQPHTDCSYDCIHTLDTRMMMLNVQAPAGPADSSIESNEPDSASLLPATRGRRPSPDTTTPARTDPWPRTLAAILNFSASPDESLNPFGLPGYRYAPARTPADSTRAQSFTVTVLEYMHNSRVCLSWHDSTLCNYEEQVWAPALARRSGHCALSGACIRRGDTVYRPQTRGRIAPLNADAMILASALSPLRES